MTGDVVTVNTRRYMVCDVALTFQKAPEAGYVFIVGLEGENTGKVFHYPEALIVWPGGKSDHLTDEEIHLYTQFYSGYIGAIKSVRERTQMGLKDAKDFVDAEVKRLNLQRANRV